MAECIVPTILWCTLSNRPSATTMLRQPVVVSRSNHTPNQLSPSVPFRTIVPIAKGEASPYRTLFLQRFLAARSPTIRVPTMVRALRPLMSAAARLQIAPSVRIELELSILHLFAILSLSLSLSLACIDPSMAVISTQHCWNQRRWPSRYRERFLELYKLVRRRRPTTSLTRSLAHRWLG